MHERSLCARIPQAIVISCRPDCLELCAKLLCDIQEPEEVIKSCSRACPKNSASHVNLTGLAKHCLRVHVLSVCLLMRLAFINRCRNIATGDACDDFLTLTA